MKKYSFIALSIIAFAGFTSCNEETVEPFTAEAGINFLEPTGSSDSWGTGYSNLFYTGDFFTLYNNGLYGQESNDFRLRVALEGRLAPTAHKVRFLVEPVEGYATPEITIPEDGVEIVAEEYTADATFSYKKPAQYSTEYRANIVFDYANSDVVAGTTERQKFLVIVKDEFKWSSMYVENRAEWDEAFVPVLGAFGEEKVRFLTATFAQLGKSLLYASYYTKYDYYAEYYGLQASMPQVIQALNDYNAEHPDSPVKEADGTLVTFPEP